MMETGVLNDNRTNMPLEFNKELANNIINQNEQKHHTPNGAGTAI